jgi:glutamate---cysteine ligase / carboxylate-amine ligase
MSATDHESHLDMGVARERFESSTDFTLAIEEEFALLDPETLELVNRFEELHAVCQRDEVLADAAVGELISSEIEIRSGKSESFAEAVERQRDRRGRLFATAGGLGIALAATGTHPWASYLDQQIIDTEHYRRLRASSRRSPTSRSSGRRASRSSAARS